VKINVTVAVNFRNEVCSFSYFSCLPSLKRIGKKKNVVLPTFLQPIYLTTDKKADIDRVEAGNAPSTIDVHSRPFSNIAPFRKSQDKVDLNCFNTRLPLCFVNL